MMITKRRSAVAVACTLACLASGARADWPSDPETPLDVGSAQAFVSIEHAVAGDGATWVGWIDAFCLGEIRVQRIDASGNTVAPGGLIIPKEEDLCGVFDLNLVANPDGSAIVYAPDPGSARAHRVETDGSLPWGDGLLPSWSGTIGAALGLPDGDTLLGGYLGMANFISRHASDGTELWSTEFPTPFSSNKRVRGLIPDDAGGAYIVFDMPLAYTRFMAASHVNANGEPTWPEPIVVIPPDPSMSRHTDPAVIGDGAGGVIVVFTEGTEQGTTPVPLLMQRFDVDGNLAFPPEGARISLDGERQFDPIVARDESTGDLLVAWRDGFLPNQELRAQRMTLDARRLWGDTGVPVADLGAPSTSWFDVVWNGATLTGLISSVEVPGPSVTAHRVDADGAFVDPAPIPLSGATDSRMVAADGSGGPLTVSWLEVRDGIDGGLVAQRLNEDGSLGTVTGDVDGDGTVDVSDLVAVIAAWGPCPARCGADLDGDGQVGVGDLLLVIVNWS